MNITKDFKSNLRISVLTALIFAMVISMVPFEAACEDLRENVLRLHIIANSDSKEDQALKIKVRNRILEESLDCFSECSNVDEAIITADINLNVLKNIAREVVKEEGFDYEVDVSIGNSDFDTRVYDEFTLPAGNYKSLIVKLGNANGKNWWCVIFPSVCVPAATNSSLSESVGKEGVEIAENAPKYEMKFKIVEWYEQIKKMILD